MVQREETMATVVPKEMLAEMEGFEGMETVVSEEIVEEDSMELVATVVARMVMAVLLVTVVVWEVVVVEREVVVIEVGHEERMVETEVFEVGDVVVMEEIVE